ncbi:MAG: acyltransferase domain-containing protein, partial [Gemmatimonadota bacterium]
MDVVLLFPGQGSQKPGMGKDVYDAHEPARQTFAAIDAALGEPLSSLCFDGPAEALTLTHNAQPALLAHGLAVWSVLRDQVKPLVTAAAGHSGGEF